jgi:hypothetical protein
MFDIPEELFTKELSEIDKLAILKDKLEKECARVGVEAEDVKSLDYYIIKEQYNDQNKHVTIKSKKD